MLFLEFIGWFGTAVVIVSMMQTRIMRLRVVNLIGCILQVIYNAALGVWPVVGLNAVLTLIQIVSIYRLLHTRHDPKSYEVVEVKPEDAYLNKLIDINRKDIEAFQPHFQRAKDSDFAFLILKGSETVGFVLGSESDNKQARIDLDYVSERFRDFTPGEFVFSAEGWFASHGYKKVCTQDQSIDYYRKIGFVPVADHFEKDLVLS